MYFEVFATRPVLIEWKYVSLYILEATRFSISDVIMVAIESQITSLTIVYSTVIQTQIKKASKLRVTGLCAGNSPGTGEFPAQRASNAENVSIWWRHHGTRTSWTQMQEMESRCEIFLRNKDLVLSCLVLWTAKGDNLPYLSYPIIMKIHISMDGAQYFKLWNSISIVRLHDYL